MSRRQLTEELGLSPASKNISKKRKASTSTEDSTPSIGAALLASHQEVEARAACVQLLQKALGGGGTVTPADPDDNVSACFAAAADEVEVELHALHDGQASKAYKAAARALAANLRRNDQLRAQVCSGDVTAAALVSMSPQEMATAAQQAEYAKMHDKGVRRATLHDSSMSTAVDTYTCPECGSQACNVMESGRRDIGKSETWGAKDVDVRRCVTCQSCGHRWNVDG